MFGKKSRSFLLLKSRIKQNSYTLYFRANQVEMSMGKSRSIIIPIMTKWHKDSEYGDLELTSGRNQSDQDPSFPGFSVRLTQQFVKLTIYYKHKQRSLPTFHSLRQICSIVPSYFSGLYMLFIYS